jgi:hypothetical protein
METWKDIIGYEGFYQISDQGRVKSLSRLVDNHSGFKKVLKEKILIPSISKTGYFVVSFKKNNKRKTFKVHRLIAFAFIPAIKGKEYVNHINGIKLDNTIKNLEWCTIKENNLHAVANKLRNDIGVDNNNSKLKKEDVLFIRESKLKLKELSLKFGICESTVSKVRLIRTYKNI